MTCLIARTQSLNNYSKFKNLNLEIINVIILLHVGQLVPSKGDFEASIHRRFCQSHGMEFNSRKHLWWSSILCWPFFAEQQTNCWFACNGWDVGMEINHPVKREEDEKLVRELMEGEKGKEMRKKAME